MGTDHQLNGCARRDSALDALLARPQPGITVQHAETQRPDGTNAHSPQAATGFTLPDPATFLKAKIRLAINRLMATYLSNWEETADQHDEAMGRLMDSLPPEHKGSMVLADSFGEVRWDAVRKHVLKVGNEGIRELEETVDALRLHS
jgi:hypothetical protein